MTRHLRPLSLAAALLLAPSSPAGDALYVAEYKFNDPHLTRLSPDGSGATPLSVLPTADWLVVGLAVDTPAGKVYWTHGSFQQGAIRRATLDGTNVETIVSGLTNPRGLALDPTGGHVYWSDTSDRALYRVKLDGTGFQTVANTGNQLGRPTLDLALGHVWFGDLGAGTILRANLDGSNPQVIVSGADDPVALALDPGGGKVYWVDAQTV
ncbi:MAG: SMP-30/gluconolactonase/LRE family protein, partial [Planctomycetota bacterium JB042]